MKILNYIMGSLLLVGTAFVSSSCSDYLDVSDDLAAELTLEQVFNNVGQTKRFHRYIYSAIPDVSNIMINGTYAGLTGLDNPWPTLSDELKASQNNTKTVPSTGYSAANAAFSRWSLYNQIRQAGIFIRDAHAITTGEETGAVITEEELATLKNEARFLRAYYHFLLFELYGPIPIMGDDNIADPSSSDLDYYRAPIDEVVSFIDSELRACLPLLPHLETSNERAAAPTKAAAYAILAKLHVYAASPLFNGGYKAAMELRDNRDIQLFPAQDKTKWQKAVSALEELFAYLESQNRNELFIVRNSDGTINAEESLYQINFVFTNNQNTEALWYTSKDSWGGVTGEGRERRCTPRDVYQGFSGIGIIQEMIDDYFMADGHTIDESPLYDKSREYELDANNIANMYKNREPRFYNDVTYSGIIWQNTAENGNPKKIYFYKGSGDDNSKADNCYTGYLLYKGLCHDLLGTGNYPRNQYRPGILFRLADFYLLYAEALNEVNPSDPKILEYVDKIRERAGIPKLQEIKPEIRGNYEAQFEAIRHERRVELFAEGQRYFDVRRWMLADKDGDCRQGGAFTGMDMNADNPQDFMNRVTFETRLFEERMYLYPLPESEVNKSKKLVQNPGW